MHFIEIIPFVLLLHMLFIVERVILLLDYVWFFYTNKNTNHTILTSFLLVLLVSQSVYNAYLFSIVLKVKAEGLEEMERRSEWGREWNRIFSFNSTTQQTPHRYACLCRILVYGWGYCSVRVLFFLDEKKCGEIKRKTIRLEKGAARIQRRLIQKPFFL